MSLGRKAKSQYEYRLRWDDVQYESGELQVVAYKDGQEWATDSVATAGDSAQLELTADRSTVNASGEDLVYLTLRVTDAEGRLAPRATNEISFQVSGPGEIVATDNGDPTDRQVFPSPGRKAYFGMALVIVRADVGQSGMITVSASAPGLAEAGATVGVQ